LRTFSTDQSYPAAGIYNATLVVSNSVSRVEAATVVTITSAIEGLTASNDSPTTLGGTTAFSATTTDGDITEYVWDFGDGNTGTGATTEHTYNAIGTYTATVTARADGGDEETATTSVRVVPLGITKTSNVSEVAPNQRIIFTLEVFNLSEGNETYTDLEISDPLPAGATFIFASDGGQLSDGVVRWNVDALAPGERVRVSLIVASETEVVNEGYEVSADGITVGGPPVTVRIGEQRLFLPIIRPVPEAPTDPTEPVSPTEPVTPTEPLTPTESLTTTSYTPSAGPLLSFWLMLWR
jgi:uncharacterized repeat protein (TIGR01451 family)